MKVEIYHYDREIVNNKIIYKTTPTYIGYAEVDKFDTYEIFNLCNWICWTSKKPSNLHGEIVCCDHGLLLINPETQEYWLSKSFGWLVGTKDIIDTYVDNNKNRAIWT